jgi:hypothetical protein
MSHLSTMDIIRAWKDPEYRLSRDYPRGRQTAHLPPFRCLGELFTKSGPGVHPRSSNYCAAKRAQDQRFKIRKHSR